MGRGGGLGGGAHRACSLVLESIWVEIPIDNHVPEKIVVSKKDSGVDLGFLHGWQCLWCSCLQVAVWPRSKRVVGSIPIQGLSVWRALCLSGQLRCLPSFLFPLYSSFLLYLISSFLPYFPTSFLPSFPGSTELSL